MALFLLLPHTYNPLTSTFSSYKHLPKTVPLSYYDYPGYGESGVYDGTPTAGAPLRQRQNATLVMLASNSHIEGAVQSVHQMEDRFNRRYKYPWIFLNDEPFSDNFKSCVLSPFPSSDRSCALTWCMKSRIGPRVRARPFWADPCRSLASAVVDRRGQGDGGEREDGAGWYRKK